MRKTVLFLVVLAVLSVASTADAQGRYQLWKEWYGNVQFGYLSPEGDYGDVTDSGWMVSGGATYEPPDWPVGIFMELSYHENDFKREILDILESDGGDVSVWGVSTGLRWAPDFDSSIGFYAKAGVGAYRVEARIFDAVWVPGWICDPWYWWYCVPGWVPGQSVTARESTTELGYNLGLGFTFDLGVTTELYLEASYFTIDTDVAKTEYMPLSLGIRW
jgi:opacity protein-like surface antigen